jgi:hypothetical protein
MASRNFWISGVSAITGIVAEPLTQSSIIRQGNYKTLRRLDISLHRWVEG